MFLFFYSQAAQLLHLIQHDFFSQLNTGNTVEVKPNEESKVDLDPKAEQMETEAKGTLIGLITFCTKMFKNIIV